MLIKIPNSDIKSIKREGAKEFKPISDVFVNPEKIIYAETSAIVLSEGVTVLLAPQGAEKVISLLEMGAE
jgi:hypothetical protein